MIPLETWEAAVVPTFKLTGDFTPLAADGQVPGRMVKHIIILPSLRVSEAHAVSLSAVGTTQPHQKTMHRTCYKGVTRCQTQFFFFFLLRHLNRRTFVKTFVRL